jgi:hypothetical protein
MTVSTSTLQERETMEGIRYYSISHDEESATKKD